MIKITSKSGEIIANGKIIPAPDHIAVNHVIAGKMAQIGMNFKYEASPAEAAIEAQEEKRDPGTKALLKEAVAAVPAKEATYRVGESFHFDKQLSGAEAEAFNMRAAHEAAVEYLKAAQKKGFEADFTIEKIK